MSLHIVQAKQNIFVTFFFHKNLLCFFICFDQRMLKIRLTLKFIWNWILLVVHTYIFIILPLWYIVQFQVFQLIEQINIHNWQFKSILSFIFSPLSLEKLNSAKVEKKYVIQWTTSLPLKKQLCPRMKSKIAQVDYML